jgi:hypothetical protein
MMKGLVVVRTDIMPVRRDEQPFHGGRKLGGRRQHAIGEDIFVRPGVRAALADIVAVDLYVGFSQQRGDDTFSIFG